MRVVLDTNIVVSRYVAPQGVVAQVLERWRQQSFELVVSEAVLSEFQRVLAYDRIRARHLMSDEEILALIEDFREFAILVEPSETADAIKDDPDDNKFLECAEAGGAEYIVSGDPHLLALKQYRGIQILSPAAFLGFLDTRDLTFTQ